MGAGFALIFEMAVAPCTVLLSQHSVLSSWKTFPVLHANWAGLMAKGNVELNLAFPVPSILTL